MPPAGFEPAIPAGERLQTHALDRSATGIGKEVTLTYNYCPLFAQSVECKRMRKYGFTCAPFFWVQVVSATLLDVDIVWY
jgi:hypothetical protein